MVRKIWHLFHERIHVLRRRSGPKADASCTTKDSTAWLYPIPQAWFLEALGAAHIAHRALSAEEEERELLASYTAKSSSQVVTPLLTPFLPLVLNHFFHTLLEGHTGFFYPMITCGLSAGY